MFVGAKLKKFFWGSLLIFLLERKAAKYGRVFISSQISLCTEKVQNLKKIICYGIPEIYLAGEKI